MIKTLKPWLFVFEIPCVSYVCSCFFHNLWSLFFCVFFFLLKNAVVFKKTNVSLCFFPFLSYVVFGSTYIICICFGVLFSIHYKKNFCFCLLEVPHYGRKCQILSKNDVIFFFFLSLMYDLLCKWRSFFGHKWQKPNLNGQ